MDESKLRNSWDPWDGLRFGDSEKGISILRETFAQEPNPSNTMSLGVGYMWIKDYERALEHFQQAIDRTKTPSERYYGFAGCARWCAGDYVGATRLWQAGIAAPYAIGGVCTHSPLLLNLAAALRQNMFSKAEAQQALLKKASDPRVRSWPGTLAQFVAGTIGDEALQASWVGYIRKNERAVLPEAKWLTIFYKKVLELDQGSLSPSEFQTSLRSMVDTSPPEWSDKRNFVHLIWNEEFFIARSEATR